MGRDHERTGPKRKALYGNPLLIASVPRTAVGPRRARGCLGPQPAVDVVGCSTPCSHSGERVPPTSAVGRCGTFFQPDAVPPTATAHPVGISLCCGCAPACPRGASPDVRPWPRREEQSRACGALQVCVPGAADEQRAASASCRCGREPVVAEHSWRVCAHAACMEEGREWLGVVDAW